MVQFVRAQIDEAEPQHGPDFDAKLTVFEARIQHGDKIEPRPFKS